MTGGQENRVVFHDGQISVSLRCTFGCPSYLYHFSIGAVWSFYEGLDLSGVSRRFGTFDAPGP